MGDVETHPVIISYLINTTDPSSNTLVLELKQLFYDSLTPGYFHNIYSVEITGGAQGVRDKQGNFMKESVIIYFKVTGHF